MKNRALVVHFVLAYAISWTFMLPVALSAQGIITANVPYALYYLASFGPALSALIVTGLTAGRAGLRSLLGRLLKWRVAIPLLRVRNLRLRVVWPGRADNRVIAGAWPDLRLLGQIDYVPYLGIPGVLGLWLLTYGLGEEIGWRGFACRACSAPSPPTPRCCSACCGRAGICRPSSSATPTSRWACPALQCSWSPSALRRLCLPGSITAQAAACCW